MLDVMDGTPCLEYLHPFNTEHLLEPGIQQKWELNSPTLMEFLSSDDFHWTFCPRPELASEVGLVSPAPHNPQLDPFPQLPSPPRLQAHLLSSGTRSFMPHSPDTSLSTWLVICAKAALLWLTSYVLLHCSSICFEHSVALGLTSTLTAVQERSEFLLSLVLSQADNKVCIRHLLCAKTKLGTHMGLFSFNPYHSSVQMFFIISISWCTNWVTCPKSHS